MEEIYLDYLATTPICEEAATAMMKMLSFGHSAEGCWGNAGSTHHLFGQRAKEALDKARQDVAKVLNCEPSEVIFESGSTETINHAIRGVLNCAPEGRNHVVLSEYEHPAVMETVLSIKGIEFTLVKPTGRGLILAEDVAKACRQNQTALVTIMMVNNELGSVNDIRQIVKAVKDVDSGILVHCDASQGIGKIPVDLRELGVDMLTVAGHKFYAPKGIAVLYLKNGTPIQSLVTGAGHESGRRAGTENVLLAVALGEALKAASSICLKRANEYRQLRERLYNRIRQQVGEDKLIRNGPTEEESRLPTALSLSFYDGLIGSEIAHEAGKHGIAFSAGAACHSGQHKPSKVLKSIGLDDDVAIGTIRLSIGRYTTEREIDKGADAIANIVAKLATGKQEEPPQATSSCYSGEFDSCSPVKRTRIE